MPEVLHRWPTGGTKARVDVLQTRAAGTQCPKAFIAASLGIMYVNKYVNLEGVNNRQQRLMCCKDEGPHDGDDWDRERRRRRRVLVLQNEWWRRKGGARPVLAVRSGH